MVFDNIEVTFEFNPMQIILWHPGSQYMVLPGSNMKYGPLAPYLA